MGNYIEVSELIDNTLYAIEIIIHDFSKVGNEYIAFKLLSTVYEALESILQSIVAASLYLENQIINSSHHNIILQLGALLKCMENEDYILLCDILEYEIYNDLAIISNELKEA